MAKEINLLTAARADALFTSDLSARCGHSPAEIAAAIRNAIRTHHGSRGCAGEVAAAYGEHEETAVQRMRWALTVINGTYSPAR
jgi:nitrogenase molybdenum-iron protein alpha/beta subunit